MSTLIKIMIISGLLPSFGLAVYFALTGDAVLAAINASVFAGVYLFNFAEVKS